MEVSGKHHAPAALPQERKSVPLSRRLGGPQGRSGRVQRIEKYVGPDGILTSEHTVRGSVNNAIQDRHLIMKLRLSCDWTRPVVQK